MVPGFTRGKLLPRRLIRLDQQVCSDGATEVSGTGFPKVPAGWYYLCHRKSLEAGPAGMVVGRQKFVVFLGKGGIPGVLSGSCSHMGVDLSNGDVVDGCLRCPIHGWRYDKDGRCVSIPALKEVPAHAGQVAYPVADLQGHLFFYNHPTPLHPMPFFDGVKAEELIASPAFEFDVDIPWYMMGSNAFDLQHFRFAHDRTIVGQPEMDQPDPMALRNRVTFEVTGNGIRDRLIRVFSGKRVNMTITVWSGTMVLVRSEFRRTTTFGMVTVLPLSERSMRARFIIWMPRRRGILSLLDPAEVRIRRLFVRAFMQPEARTLSGLNYNPASMTEADDELKRYATWLSGIVAKMPNVSGGS
jgi:phenylpropionate dioxygenase-like ring-hydroxylating dioxygenase large terminal subunit